jgi:hypothetical protein
MWPRVVVHEHWSVSQRMIVEMGDYAWSEHIATVFLACQITIKNVQDFKAPNFPLSLRLKGSGCHYYNIYNNTGTK